MALFLAKRAPQAGSFMRWLGRGPAWESLESLLIIPEGLTSLERMALGQSDDGAADTPDGEGDRNVC